MGNDIKFAGCSKVLIVPFVCIAVALSTNTVWPYASKAGAPVIGGPWEILVQSRGTEAGLRFPVEVRDENKPVKLNKVLPLMGTPVKIRLEEYLPDLKWETVAIERAGGGVVAKLTVTGKDLNQEMWLNSSDLMKRSISSPVGSVAIRELHDAGSIERTVHELMTPKAVGVVSVWPNDANTPIEYVANVTETIQIPQSKYKLSILEYLPHYSVDTVTKKVTNLSPNPVNPAIKVKLDNGRQNIERWLWSKFPEAPHMGTDHVKVKLPLRIEFADFDLAGEQGRYILVVALRSEAWLLFREDGKTRAERVELNRAYLFADSKYYFKVDSIAAGAVIETKWRNNSESLLHPAVVATIENGDTGRQTVLELNKPHHHRTGSETIVLLYRCKTGPSEVTD